MSRSEHGFGRPTAAPFVASRAAEADSEALIECPFCGNEITDTDRFWCAPCKEFAR